ncbi:thrombospondin type 3 repeat-containing protein [Thiohalomonas denitrificans]|uniref:thrombospondin type 3 repeat-containing protein n=1 Tax=Thiohalomonas denitrificans TaxID=415747 RepID=UPI001C312800|nr:thrombospondin type 3 repeat-containing protein [Thiohalomonas denitrificans]
MEKINATRMVRVARSDCCVLYRVIGLVLLLVSNAGMGVTTTNGPNEFTWSCVYKGLDAASVCKSENDGAACAQSAYYYGDPDVCGTGGGASYYWEEYVGPSSSGGGEYNRYVYGYVCADGRAPVDGECLGDCPEANTIARQYHGDSGYSEPYIPEHDPYCEIDGCEAYVSEWDITEDADGTFSIYGEMKYTGGQCGADLDHFSLISDPDAPVTGCPEGYEFNGTTCVDPNGTETDPVPPDADNDGVPDEEDAFPYDPDETTDTDGDGVGDNADQFPEDPNETTDTDGDGVGDNADQFPEDPNETTDTDGDGLGDNADTDRDNDGVPDGSDAFPDDPTEWADTDGDGIGDNADTDANNDGIEDSEEEPPAEGEVTFNGCDSAPVCTGDDIACGQLQMAWEIRCGVDEIFGAPDEAVAALATLETDDSRYSEIDVSDMLVTDGGWLGDTASCPPARTVDVLGADVRFSFQPLCDLAGWLSALVMMIAGMVAVKAVGEGIN